MRLYTPKSNHLVGVDLSATSIKMVEVQNQQGVYHLKTYGIEDLELGQIVDSTIVNIEVLGQLISELAWRVNVSAKTAATAVSGSAVITKLIDMEANLTDREREAQIRLDADKYIPYPLSEVNLDFEEVGPSPVNADLVQVLLAASRSENVEQRVDALAFGGFETKVMDIEAHAIERAFQLIENTLPNDLNLIALVDIGHTHTTLYVVKNGEFVYSRDQLFGGAQLTDAIQTKYGMTHEEATYNKHEMNLPSSYRSEVLLPFMESLIQQITRSLQFYYSSSQYTSVDHVVLCGGSASLAGLVCMVEQEIGTKVTLANPFTHMTIDPKVNIEQLEIDAPKLMVACGLALRSFD